MPIPKVWETLLFLSICCLDEFMQSFLVLNRAIDSSRSIWITETGRSSPQFLILRSVLSLCTIQVPLTGDAPSPGHDFSLLHFCFRASKVADFKRLWEVARCIIGSNNSFSKHAQWKNPCKYYPAQVHPTLEQECTTQGLQLQIVACVGAGFS